MSLIDGLKIQLWCSEKKRLNYRQVPNLQSPTLKLRTGKYRI